jgi:hypothetical protein
MAAKKKTATAKKPAAKPAVTKEPVEFGVYFPKLQGFGFPFVVKDEKAKEVTGCYPTRDIVFCAGHNNLNKYSGVDPEELFYQMVSHPVVQQMEGRGELVLYDGRKDGTESNLGLALTDVKENDGKQEGVPVSDIVNTRPKVQTSDNKDGLTEKTSIEPHAHGEQPLPSMD